MFLCLRRATFVQSHKSGEKDSLKNFSVILSVCWFTKDNGESLHPILLDSFGIFISVISMQSDREKFLADAFFCPPSLEGGGPLAVKDFFYTLCLRRPTFVCQQQKWATLLKPDDFQSKCLSAHSLPEYSGTKLSRIIEMVSVQSDREKFLADAFLFFIKLPVSQQSVGQKNSYLACQFQQEVFCIPYKSIEYEAHSHWLVRLLVNKYL